jgi:hypothetical protein
MFLPFFSFNGINNLRVFNVTFSSIPTAPTIHLPDGSTLTKTRWGLGRAIWSRLRQRLLPILNPFAVQV